MATSPLFDTCCQNGETRQISEKSRQVVSATVSLRVNVSLNVPLRNGYDLRSIKVESGRDSSYANERNQSRN